MDVLAQTFYQTPSIEDLERKFHHARKTASQQQFLMQASSTDEFHERGKRNNSYDKLITHLADNVFAGLARPRALAAHAAYTAWLENSGRTVRTYWAVHERGAENEHYTHALAGNKVAISKRENNYRLADGHTNRELGVYDTLEAAVLDGEIYLMNQHLQ